MTGYFKFKAEQEADARLKRQNDNKKKMKALATQLRDLQHKYEDTDREFARTIGRAKDAIRIKFNL